MNFYSHALTAVLALGVGVLIAQVEPRCPPDDETPTITKPATFADPPTAATYRQYSCWHAMIRGERLGRECA